MRTFVEVVSALAFVVSLPCLAQTGDEASCEAKYKNVAPAAIKLPFHEFDQSPEGFRKLGNCWAEAALLLRRYADKQAYEMRSIRWHLAQTLAMQGDSAAAAESALLSLQPLELEQKSTFSWNTYVLATIGFLRNDRAAFDAQYEAHRIAAEKSSVNQTNLNVLKSLANCFGRPYKDAYPVCNAAP